MANFRWDIALAVFGVVVPSMAFLYEFVLVGRKRLGYRVQMDTTATAEIRPEYARLPQLLPRPIAFSLFTLVINKQAGVQDLSLDQIRQLYAGRIANWTEVGGNNQPVRLVSRDPDSGTRKTLQQQILGGTREPGSTSDDCEEVAPGAQPGVTRCERKTTDEVMGTVARIPGAIGYSDVGDASGRKDLLLVRIGGHQATLGEADRGAYPFWETEYAYTYGEPRADSLTASFLRYSTDEVGKDIVRSHGSLSCSELQNPVLCRPS